MLIIQRVPGSHLILIFLVKGTPVSVWHPLHGSGADAAGLLALPAGQPRVAPPGHLGGAAAAAATLPPLPTAVPPHLPAAATAATPPEKTRGRIGPFSCRLVPSIRNLQSWDKNIFAKMSCKILIFSFSRQI